jgi:predicted PurR-regulated permease PerM
MKNLNNLFLIAMVIIVGIGMYYIFEPFLISLFMAFILSQLFKSWYDKILFILKKPALASFTTSLLIFLIIFAPLLLITKLAVSEIIDTYQLIDSGDLKNDTLALRDRTLSLANSYSLPSGVVNPTELIHKIDVNNLVKQISSLTTLVAKYIYQGMSQLLFTLFITFFCLYYFFKDNKKMVTKIFDLSPLKNSQEKKLLKNFVEISRATLKGSLVIAAVQGFLTTILFIFTGVSSAVLLGIVATLLALIPMIGTAIIWVPAGIIMLIMGNIWQGVTILLFGALVIGMIDNFLRPQLVGNSTSLHPLIIFLSTLGGISFFGLTGFLLGPVTAVLFLNLLAIYKSEFKEDLKRFNR